MIDEVAQFSELGERYDATLARGLSVTGESADHFARARLARVRELAQQNRMAVRALLDFGCGVGSSFAIQRELFPEARIIGFEPADGLRALAQRAAQSASAEVVDDARALSRLAVDLVYCNGVYHHIPVSERARATAGLVSAVRLGGLACVWENSPYNPGTRLVMSRVAFDRAAELLSPRALRGLVSAAGLTPVATEFHFIFPRALRMARPLEPLFRSLPFGGQYLVVARNV